MHVPIAQLGDSPARLVGRRLGRAAGGPGSRRPGRAFTLVEILIVVVILGILASIVIPQFSNASQTAKENVLKDEVRYLRTQIIVYKAQHNDVAPGYPSGLGSTPDATTFINQMADATDLFGVTSATYDPVTYKYGPYLSKMPANPLNGYDTVQIVANGGTFPPTPDDQTGWFYKPQTQEIVPNSSGKDSAGLAYIDY